MSNMHSFLWDRGQRVKVNPDYAAAQGKALRLLNVVPTAEYPIEAVHTDGDEVEYSIMANHKLVRIAARNLILLPTPQPKTTGSQNKGPVWVMGTFKAGKGISGTYYGLEYSLNFQEKKVFRKQGAIWVEMTEEQLANTKVRQTLIDRYTGETNRLEKVGNQFRQDNIRTNRMSRGFYQKYGNGLIA